MALKVSVKVCGKHFLQTQFAERKGNNLELFQCLNTLSHQLYILSKFDDISAAHM